MYHNIYIPDFQLYRPESVSLASLARQLSSIGQGHVTKNMDGAPVDCALLIKDTEAVEMVS